MWRSINRRRVLLGAIMKIHTVCSHFVLLIFLLLSGCIGTRAATNETWKLVKLVTAGGEAEISNIETVVVRNCETSEKMTTSCSAGTTSNLSVSLGGGGQFGEGIVGEIGGEISSSLGIGKESGTSLELESPPTGMIYTYEVTKTFKTISGMVSAQSSIGVTKEVPYVFYSSCTISSVIKEKESCDANDSTVQYSTPIVNITPTIEVRAENVIPEIEGKPEGIEDVIGWWDVIESGFTDGVIDPSVPFEEKKCYGLAWNTEQYGYHHLIVFQKPTNINFIDGGWYVKLCIPNHVDISPQDIGEIQTDWLGKAYDIDNTPWQVTVLE